MNPFELDATGLMVWGLVAHLIADWPLQNDWMANNKADLRNRAGYVHAGIHTALLLPVFGWAALLVGLSHLLIDTRVPVVWWSRLVRQTPPHFAMLQVKAPPPLLTPAVDVGLMVRFWTDQVFHIACIATAALVVGALA